jgi:polyisoprenoid-binding protein YceI
MLRTTMLAFGLLAATAAAAGAEPYAYDPPHTTAAFTAVHLAIIKVHGSVPFVSGKMDIGANDLPTAGDATFNLAAIDSGDPNRDKSLRTQYLETDKYPTMTFVVRKVTGTPKAFDLIGDLTLHGVTKSVDLKSSEVGATTVKGKREIGYSASTTIDRRDFGITFGTGITDAALSVSTNIDIDIEAAFLQQ